MAIAHDPSPRIPLRLWPGVVAAVLLLLLRFVIPVVAPEALFFGEPTSLIGMLGGLTCGLAIIVWWLFFSRAPWSERVAAIGLMVVAVAATYRVVHASIANGMMGLMLPMFAIPVLSLALVVSLAATRRRSTGLRRASMVAAILLACGVFTTIRTGGVTGDGQSDLHWRWTPTPEERLLAHAGDQPVDSARPEAVPAAPPPSTGAAAPAPETPRAPDAAGDPLDSAPGGAPPPASAPAVADTPETHLPAPADAPATGSATAVEAKADADLPATTERVDTGVEWPGFRGSSRDSVVRGVRIETDWSRTPPVELWRRPIGPGWSSFAVRGDLVYTQEQRGDEEVVSCYSLTTGEPVWRHSDPIRFWESNGGAGPRGTPTVSNGRVYTMGATGLLNALDAGNGAAVWSRNAAADTSKTVPDWGIASSPLVFDDLVIVAVAGQLAAYDVRTGDPRWFGPTGGGGYSSPHLVTINGVAQILLLRGARTISVAPADGSLLWDYSWVPGVSILQPALTVGGDVLIAGGDAMGGMGIRRVAVTHAPGGWTVEERWTSRGLKPYFNDFVVHNGHAFGFDGSILSGIDLEDGERKWKGGRYGHGQLVLLPDQNLLLVLSEDGELALVSATPDKYTELARFQAMEAKTWNHPALVGDVLLVRNGEEMVAFRLPLAER